uniref:FHA domain-containing protein n=1 Tax=Glossina brevipalpis TaxID=37001 RepID=A0A1A9WQL6_9MUSC
MTKMSESIYSSWVLEKITTGEIMRLRKGRNKIGRHSSCHVRLIDCTHVSRIHAAIIVSEDNKNVKIQDLESANGIYINDVLNTESSVVDLHVNDTIGFGVSKYDSAVDIDVFKLPIFQLIMKPIQELSKTRNSLPMKKSTYPEKNDEQARCSIEAEKEKPLLHIKKEDGVKINNIMDEMIILSSDEEENNAAPTTNPKDGHGNGNRNAAFIHLPMESSLKREYVQSISNDLESIFGNLDGDDEMQNKIKEINPLVYNGITGRPLLFPVACDKTLENGDVIDLCGEDEDVIEGVVELGTLLANENCMKSKELSKSPNIFESSKEDESNFVENVKNPSVPDNEASSHLRDYIDNDDENDDEEFMFSQAVINDMKSDLDYEDNLNVSDPPESNQLVIKQEPGITDSNNFTVLAKPVNFIDPNTCWDISDDEENDDENLRMWSKRLLSQSFSQVYELNEETLDEQADNRDEEENPFGINIDDELDEIADFFNQINADEENLKEEMFSTINKMKASDTKTNENNQTMSTKESMNKLENNKPTSEKDLPFSPVIRKSNLKTRRIERVSSDESEKRPEDNAISKITAKKEQSSKRKQIPPVIEAPRLPRHKNKLRGVSAVPISKNFTTETKHQKRSETSKASRKEKSKTDLNLNSAKSKEKYDNKQLKEHRKERLKQLAERQKSPCKENLKRKHSEDKNDGRMPIKNVKVKLTHTNRGAFLAEDDASKNGNEKIRKVSRGHKIIEKAPGKFCRGDKLQRRSSLSFESFSQQISKPDELITKLAKGPNKHPAKKRSQTSTPLRRFSLSEQIEKRKNSNAVPVCKEALAARALRTTNKITFASMERHLNESMESARKLAMAKRQVCAATNTFEAVAATSTAGIVPSTAFADTAKEKNVQNATSVNIIKKNKPKKRVRFNDVPTYHYIEPIAGAVRKVVDKDFLPRTTHKDRLELLSSQFRIIDHTDEIITDILNWSNKWLIKRCAAEATEIVCPMPRQFNTFDHYKRSLLSLMQLEFMSKLEREYKLTASAQQFRVKLETVSVNKGRLMLVTTYNYQHSHQATYARYDIVILNFRELKKETFAFVSENLKRSDNVSTLIYEIIPANIDAAKLLKDTKELTVRPVIDNVRVEFGSFNAVYQLESTPLFKKIINPLELLNGKLPPKKKIAYKACDRFLNERQRNVLLSTYTRIIDDTTPNITLIQGPPGTGKSQVIANLALQTLYGEEVRYLDRKILICAQSNAAVDVIASKLYAISLRMRVETRFRLIRFGNSEKISPNVQPVFLQNVVVRDQMKKLMKWKCNDQNAEDLKKQILQLEAEIATARASVTKGTVEEDKLKEQMRQLELARGILKGSMRPDDERRIFSWYLNNAHIVCATLSSCVKLTRYVNFFDVCIIDEATQCIEPWTLVPLRFLITSLVLVGDTRQLPATVLSQKANDLGLSTSMFTRIQNCLDGAVNATNLINYNCIVSCLNVQYRMHPEICKWPNLYFYKKNLIDGSSTRKLQTPLKSFVILNLDYAQNERCEEGKIFNSMEAEFVAKLLKALDDYIPSKCNSYGVITPYAQHRETLNTAIKSMGLTKIMVNTIDSYQGLEKDVIIISNARTNGIGFLSSPQRLNVAITRPKKCLILCGNFKNLETVPAWRSLLDNARERKLFYEITNNCTHDMQNNVIEKIKLKKPLQPTNSN